MCCMKCKKNEATTYTNFCYDCQPGWLQSEERANVQWDSDESYDAAAIAYAMKAEVVKEEAGT